MERRQLVGAVLAAVIGLLVIVAVGADGGGDGHHGATNERAAAVEVLPSSTTPALPTTTTTIAKPVAIAMAPCAVNGSIDPYLVVCGPSSLQTGDRGTFEVVARGHIRDDCGSPFVDWADGSGNVVCMIACPAYPPDEHSIDRKLTHTYSDPGVYTLRFVLQGCGADFRPQAEITMEVVVR